MINGEDGLFLGSGFSKEAGGLVQNEIIKTILDEDFTRGKRASDQGQR